MKLSKSAQDKTFAPFGYSLGLWLKNENGNKKVWSPWQFLQVCLCILMWKPCVLIFHLVVISPRHDVSLQVISCLQLSPFFFALTHSRQQTHSFLAIFLFLSTFSFLQLYEMSVCWMKFGFQLSGTHRPVSHTHTALGLISFANITSPNTTSETHSLALLPWEKGDPQFFCQ